MNILVLGNSQDAHARHVKDALAHVGAIVDYLDTRLFPTQLHISWQPGVQLGLLAMPDGYQVDLQDVHSVFWRNYPGVYVPPLEDAHQQQIALNDSLSTVRTFMQACPAHWVNSWQAYQLHKEKPLQLSKVRQVGTTIPATLISNDPQQVIDFAQTYQNVIFKPVYGGAHTQFVSKAHLELQRLRLALSISPVTIQEYIPGTNIRSYVIAESVYSAEIRSSALDFREDAQARLIPLRLPEAVHHQCLAIAKTLMLEWTAIDWRLKPTGEYVFLEANPSPMFLHFEQQTGLPITQELVKLLTN